jgi:hypothetical protein
MIKIEFEFTTAYGVYKDALHLPENHTYSDEEIVAMQLERLNNWLNIIETSSSKLPTVEIGGVLYEKVEIDGQVVLKPVEA